jgi:hypothetical protein
MGCTAVDHDAQIFQRRLLSLLSSPVPAHQLMTRALVAAADLLEAKGCPTEACALRAVAETPAGEGVVPIRRGVFGRVFALLASAAVAVGAMGGCCKAEQLDPNGHVTSRTTTYFPMRYESHTGDSYPDTSATQILADGMRALGKDAFIAGVGELSKIQQQTQQQSLNTAP